MTFSWGYPIVPARHRQETDMHFLLIAAAILLALHVRDVWPSYAAEIRMADAIRSRQPRRQPANQSRDLLFRKENTLPAVALAVVLAVVAVAIHYLA